MARPLRIEYQGAVYHITCRGNEKKDIFRDDTDRKKFLDILLQSLTIYKVKLYSYVLMSNHFHLLLETPLGNLGEFMRQFNITYTGYFNKRHRRAGHLYQGRYRSILVEKASYLSILSRYIHLNPVRIKRMEKAPYEEKIKYLTNYVWSSLPGYIKKRKKERHIDYAMVLEEYGGDTGRARNAYKQRIYADISEGIEIKDKIFSQSILGEEEFIEWIKDTFIKKDHDRECPSLSEIQRYKQKDDILRTIEEETGKKGIKEISTEKGRLRQMTMELLYRLGGLKGTEIGKIMGVGYTSVSQERRRLQERLQKDRKIRTLLSRIEMKLSRMKI
ncbi:MAG: transposase [Candidatus Mariimomonas ferrooxydans]